MAGGGGSSIGRKIAVVCVAGIALVGLTVVVRYLRTDHRSEFCTLAASIGGTLRSSPEAAFDDWWDGQFPDGPSQDDAEIDRDGNVWRVHEGQEDGRWIKVEVQQPRELSGAGSSFAYEDPAGLGTDGWSVHAANTCHDA